MSKISRREARTSAVRVMFGADLHKDEDPSSVFEVTCNEGELQSNEFAKDLFLGACEHLGEIDEAIAQNSKGWKVERIS